MIIALHPNARTTPAVRAEIAASSDSVAVLAARYGVGNLKALLPAEPKEPVKGFKAYEPGYVHVDVKYLPQSALHSRTPMQELERWHNEKPELFQRQSRVPNRPGCDT